MVMSQGRVLCIAKSCDTSLMEERFLTQSDREYIEASVARSPKRVREQSLWRAMLRKTLYENEPTQKFSKADILYDEVGAPYIADADFCFSVSHSRSNVAIIISNSYKNSFSEECAIDSEECAIDIEELDRDFESVASRFATTDEIRLCGDKNNLAMIWSAKECAYKLLSQRGEKNLDFIKDIIVTDIDTEAKKIEVQTNLYLHTFHYSFTELEHHVIVASLDFEAPQ